MSTYVVQGLAHFLSHPALWRTALCPFLSTLLVAIASIVVLLSVALRPQAESLEGTGMPLWLSWLLAVMLVLVEILIVTFVYKLIVMGHYQDKIFEQVMVARGYKDLVENTSQHAGWAWSCRSCCRVSVWRRLTLLVATLPLNVLPIVGSVIYAWKNGTILAWEYHLLYFEFKHLSYEEQRAFIEKHKIQYSSFGMQALLLEMMPVIGSVFVFTNAVGAALFAAHLEDEEDYERVQGGGVQPSWNKSKCADSSAYNYSNVPSGGMV